MATSQGGTAETNSSKDTSSNSGVFIPKDELDFSNICNQPKIETVDQWFDEWVANFFLKKPFSNMLVVGSNMVEDIENHVSSLETYLSKLKQLKSKVAVYATEFMKVKMFGMLNLMNQEMGQDYRLNDKLSQQTELASFKELIQQSVSDFSNLQKISQVYHDDIKYASQPNPDRSDIHQILSPQINEYIGNTKIINTDACGVLINIVNLFSNNPSFVDVGKRLQREEKGLVLLEAFFENFQFILKDFKPEVCGKKLDPNTIRGAFSNSIIGVDIEKNLKTSFFSPRLFKSFSKNHVEVEKVWKFDKFILVGKDSYERLSKIKVYASTPIPFSVDFINEFPNQPFEISEDSSLSVEKQRETTMFVLLYKIYIIMRSDQYKLITKSMKLKEVYTVMLEWIISTDYFDHSPEENKIAEEIAYSASQLKSIKSSDLQKQNLTHNFIQKDEFILYFSSMVTYLIRKTGISIKTKKPQISKKVDELPILLDLRTLNFQGDSIDNEMLAIVDDKIKKNKLSLLSKAILGLKYDPVIQACTVTKGPKTSPQSSVIFTYKCIRPIYEEWHKIFKEYLSEITEKDDVEVYISTIESSVESLRVKSRKDLITFTIITYFRMLSQKKDSELKVFERKMCEKYLSRAMVETAGKIDSDQIFGFQNFLVGVSSKELFGKYFHTLNDFEGEFHGFNIYYIALASQVLKAKKLKLQNRMEEFDKVMAYKNEMKTVFESRYPRLEENFRKDYSTRPFRHIKSIFKQEFFINFLDFFNLFYGMTNASRQPTSPIFNNAYISVHSVFVNFYHFLFMIRENVVGEVEEPYDFALEKLEECLQYSSRPTAEPRDSEKEGLCPFSDRKYSEMYFFFKLYLVVYQKKEGVTLDNFSPERLNTHTRMLFLYSKNDQLFQKTINDLCSQEAFRSLDFCITWMIFEEFYKIIINSTQRGSSFSFVRSFFTEKILKNTDVVSLKHIKFNILFAAEAICLLVEGEIVNYSRYLSLFNLGEHYALMNPGQLEVDPEDKKILDLFKVTPDDAENRVLMVQYLKRTYIKSGRKDDEVAVTEAILSIMDQSLTENIDFLDFYFTFEDHHIFDFVKLFLMYMTKDSHFEKMADYLIKNGIFMELANFNRPNDDPVYLEITSKLAMADDNYLEKSKNPQSTQSFPHNLERYREILRNDLHDRYVRIIQSASRKLMKMSQADNEVSIDEQYVERDLFSELFNMNEEDLASNDSVDEKSFKSINKKIVLNSSVKSSQDPSLDTFQSSGYFVEMGSRSSFKSKTEMLKQLMADSQSSARQSFDTRTFEDDDSFLTFSEKSLIDDQLQELGSKLGMRAPTIEPNSLTSTVMEELVNYSNEISHDEGFIKLYEERTTKVVREKRTVVTVFEVEEGRRRRSLKQKRISI